MYYVFVGAYTDIINKKTKTKTKKRKKRKAMKTMKNRLKSQMRQLSDKQKHFVNENKRNIKSAECKQRTMILVAAVTQYIQ